MTATTSKLGADLTNEQRQAIEWAADRFAQDAIREVDPQDRHDFNESARVLRELLARQTAAIDKQEAVAYRDFGRLAQYFDDIGDPHGANVIRTYRDNLYAAPLANEASKPAPSVEQDERGENHTCQTCKGSGVVDDGEIAGSGGVEYENGPIKCVKDCPDCAASTSANVAQGAEAQVYAAIERGDEWDQRVLRVRMLDGVTLNEGDFLYAAPPAQTDSKEKK
ncbi:hypothetical protein [Paraburkholderia caledonica]|uniref:hypothetical protein n=1 Tax=Paraburkholderia caledonica TaxID=134536 RepID=UPI0038BB196A